MKSVIALILISSTAIAQVQHLDKGTPAPTEGYLFTVDAEKVNRAQLLDLDVYKQLDESNKRMLDLRVQENQVLNEQYQTWKNQSTDLSKQLVASKNDTFWHSLIYFGLGCLLTTGLAYGVTRVTR